MISQRSAAEAAAVILALKQRPRVIAARTHGKRALSTTDAAVDSTAGQYVRYKGEICDIYYFASDGGATEDGANVFELELPYLRGVSDPFEQAVDYSMRNWYAYRSG